MKNISLVSCHLKFLFYCDCLIPTSTKYWLLEVFTTWKLIVFFNVFLKKLNYSETKREPSCSLERGRL